MVTARGREELFSLLPCQRLALSTLGQERRPADFFARRVPAILAASLGAVSYHVIQPPERAMT